MRFEMCLIYGLLRKSIQYPTTLLVNTTLLRRGNEQPAVLFPILLQDRKIVKTVNRGRGYNCPIVWDYNLQQCTFWKQHVYVYSIVFYYCGTLNGVTVQLFFIIFRVRQVIMNSCIG